MKAKDLLENQLVTLATIKSVSVGQKGRTVMAMVVMKVEGQSFTRHLKLVSSKEFTGVFGGKETRMVARIFTDRDGREYGSSQVVTAPLVGAILLAGKLPKSKTAE